MWWSLIFLPSDFSGCRQIVIVQILIKYLVARGTGAFLPSLQVTTGYVSHEFLTFLNERMNELRMNERNILIQKLQ